MSLRGLAALALLAVAGCAEPDVEVVRHPKPPRGGGLHWQVPAGWTEEPGSGMRAATLKTPRGLEVAVVRLEGDAGGIPSNVNRWREQLDLRSLPEKEAAAAGRPVETPVGRALVFDISAADKRMLVAMLPRDGSSWFFKLTGGRAAVGAEASAFAGLLKGIHEAH